MPHTIAMPHYDYYYAIDADAATLLPLRHY
jgi:hypothetical protein